MSNNLVDGMKEYMLKIGMPLSSLRVEKDDKIIILIEGTDDNENEFRKEITLPDPYQVNECREFINLSNF